MKLRTQQFPHISRLFPVWLIFLGEHLFLVVFVVSLIIAHVYASNTIKGICCSRAIYSVLQNPYDIEAKLSLARWYWQNGQKLNAIRETDIVRDMLGSTSMPKTNSDSLVLGTMTSKLEETLLAFHPAPPIANTEESFWKKIVEERPDYRDGYIILALLSYKRKSFSEAMAYKSKALALDPNYPLPKELLALQ